MKQPSFWIVATLLPLAPPAVFGGWALSLVTAGPLAAQEAPLLVSTEWLADNLDDANLVVLHVGNQSSFDQGHVQGARLLPLQSFAPEVEGMSTEMPDPDALRESLEAAGVSDGSRIVIYSASHPPQLAARLYVTLEHLGLTGGSSLLDGGLRAWQSEGRPISTEAAPVERGSLSELRPGSAIVADHVRARLEDGRATVMDARDPQFWTGEQQNQQRAARPGRVPGAVNLPFRTVVDESGRFLPEEEIRALFRTAGVEEGAAVVTYCHVGQQASLLFFAARMLGLDARLYDGSYEDWSGRMELPVDTGP
jgi:thiosulfate/3-mercaptopyruvate sulfurtransferase